MNDAVESSPADAQSASLIWRVLTWSYKLYDLWFTLLFIAMSAQIVLLSHNIMTIVLTILPPFFALVHRNNPKSLPSSRLLASLFLLLISLADAFAFLTKPYHWRPVPGASPIFGAMFAWYSGVYLLFLFVILPPFLFLRPLAQARRGEHPYFSKFTCLLGLCTWLILMPLLVATTMQNVWPLIVKNLHKSG